ncbi:MAG: hypothetical protein [Cressdnaviricota sp.]|nr:MAG: hypothetical protein [Cressdnaviricota sp.]
MAGAVRVFAVAHASMFFLTGPAARVFQAFLAFRPFTTFPTGAFARLRALARLFRRATRTRRAEAVCFLLLVAAFFLPFPFFAIHYVPTLKKKNLTLQL